MHSLLQRQLRRHAIDSATLGPEGRALLDAVEAAYDSFDTDRLQVERSLELSSQELFAANGEMRVAAALLHATLDSTADGILAVGADGSVIHANARFAALWAIPEELLALRDDAALLDFVLSQLSDPEAFVAKVRELYGSSLESLDSITFRDGRVFERYSRPLLDTEGIAGRVWSFRDVTESRRASLALRESEERFRALVQHSSDMILILDINGSPTYASPSVERIMGYTPEDLRENGVLARVHPDDLQGAADSLAAVLLMSGAHPPKVLRFLHNDGSWRAIEMVANNMLDDPAVAGVVYNARDVTERVELERQMQHQAFHDSLTGLANRVLFTDRLANALARAQRTGLPVAVLFIDIDNFKSINDAFGHVVGDHVLIELARRIGATLRTGDTAARVGGDEFTLLLEGMAPDDAVAVGERIVAAMRTPIEIEARDIFVEVSIGVAVSGAGEAAGERLLRDADVAMYAAKGRGKARVELYDDGMFTSLHDRLQLLADLQTAIERKQFFVQYQPTFNLASGRIAGAEALVRWNHPDRGTIPPLDFIPLAEEGGVIHALGTWVLQEACTQLKRWQTEYPQDPPLHIAVNVSGHQLQPGFVREVESIIAGSDIEPSTLVLEVTESVMMRDIPATVALLNELKILGVRLAIDDFGTGYSSLRYLRQFPFDILKIDKSFIDDVGSNKQHELTAAIVEIGRTLRLELVAEGIERADQLDRLLSLQCDIGQGYYFAKPLFAQDMEALLAERQAEAEAA